MIKHKEKSKPLKPDYDSAAILRQQMETTVSEYEKGGSLQSIADRLDLNPIKVRKLLITAGVYKSEIADRVQKAFAEKTGMSEKQALEAVMRELNLSRASVTSYLPYRKGVYCPHDCDTEQISVGAERIQRMRKRQRMIEALQLQTDVDHLWDCIVAFQSYGFRTISGLPFSYSLKVGRNGELTKELWVDRRENSKGITWSSVMLAFEKALQLKMEHKPVEKPKALGDIRGVSYLFPIFYRFGLINVPDEISKRLK